MTNFNSLNNINFNQNMGNYQRNISNTPAQIVQQNINQTPNQGQNPNQNALLNQQRTLLNPEFLFNFETFQMDNETVTKYLQNLLKLPNSLDKFMQEINNPKLNPKALNILVENLVNLKAIGELLNDNSKAAIQKLLQTIAQAAKSTGGNTEQLKEMLSVLSSIQSSNLNATTNTIKELLLLYIPIDIQAFNKEVEFKNLSEEEQEKVQSSALSIMIETINFSNILCLINENDNSLYIELSANENFTFDKFKTIVEVLARESSIKTYIEFKPAKKYQDANSKQNFKIVSGGFVQTNVLILAHIIIKAIFKIDSDFGK